MDDDGLYDSLPEMCDSSDHEMDISLSMNRQNVFYLPFDKKTTVDSFSNQDESRPLSACICSNSVQWAWEHNDNCTFVEIDNNNMDVKFHRNHSSGTALVRCTEPMVENQYYWEVKITHPVYGTDVMLGVGTPDVEVKDCENRFVSLLGNDKKTWGLSYTGLFHHDGVHQSYTQCFRQGDIIGAHLDLWRGTLSFYKDRKYLGIATSGLKGKTLYAMASSTAAYSGMRIIHSQSFPSSLQFLCCFKLRELIPDDQNVLDVLNLPPGLKQFLKKNLNWLLSKRNFDGSDVCRYNHDRYSYEDLVDESSMGRVIDHLINEPMPCVLFDWVVFRNFNGFQGERDQRNQREMGDSAHNISMRLRRPNEQESDYDSD